VGAVSPPVAAQSLIHRNHKEPHQNGRGVSTYSAAQISGATSIYTTNATESINMVLHKITKNRSSFPIDDAESELLYLALNNIS